MATRPSAVRAGPATVPALRLRLSALPVAFTLAFIVSVDLRIITVVGADHDPSAAYASIDAVGGVGPIHVTAQGAGPHDGFTAYKVFVGDPPRTRWGDHGAAAMDGHCVWIASEYIGQCWTLAEYLAPPLGSCGDTGTSLGNWSTRITLVVP
jgi:hypothetical protein